MLKASEVTSGTEAKALERAPAVAFEGFTLLS
jgi:hypothetical protein